jgi:hypothetical protein
MSSDKLNHSLKNEKNSGKPPYREEMPLKKMLVRFPG